MVQQKAKSIENNIADKAKKAGSAATDSFGKPWNIGTEHLSFEEANEKRLLMSKDEMISAVKVKRTAKGTFVIKYRGTIKDKNPKKSKKSKKSKKRDKQKT
tara:strand:- start:368 stop:670 length:303 start_codon:yes stop_codon:yes gene_type:complete